MFSIEINSKYWINGTDDDPNDLCPHGDVKAYIGEEVFEYSCTISAMALRLLKTLSEDHIVLDPYNGQQMLPCCGHFIIPNDNLDEVYITGCAYGINWNVFNEEGKVRIVTKSGKETIVEKAEYKREVRRVVDEIEDYYMQCKPKVIPSEIFERNGYSAFWNEWHRRRNQL